MKPSRPSPNTSPSILSRAARLLALLVAAAALFVPGLASADDAESLTYQITTQGREVGTRTLKVHYLGTETGELRLMESWTEVSLPLPGGTFRFRQRLAGQARGSTVGGFVASNEEDGTPREIQAVRREDGWAVIIAERTAFGEIPLDRYAFDATSLSLADPGLSGNLREGRFKVLTAETGEILEGQLTATGPATVQIGGASIRGEGWTWSTPEGQIELIYGPSGHLLRYTMIVSRLRLDAQLITPPPERDFSEAFRTPLISGGVQEEDL